MSILICNKALAFGLLFRSFALCIQEHFLMLLSILNITKITTCLWYRPPASVQGRCHRKCHHAGKNVSGLKTHLEEQVSDNHFPRVKFCLSVLLNNVTAKLPQSSQLFSEGRKLFTFKIIIHLWDIKHTQVKEIQVDVLTVEISALNDTCKERLEM